MTFGTIDYNLIKPSLWHADLGMVLES